MNEITFNILKIVVSVSAAIITIYLVPYIRNKLKDDKYKELLAIVEVAVKAAEQTIGGGHGKVKKEEVVAFVSLWLSQNGIQITDKQLDNLIEAAVFQMNNSYDITVK